MDVSGGGNCSYQLSPTSTPPSSRRYHVRPELGTLPCTRAGWDCPQASRVFGSPVCCQERLCLSCYPLTCREWGGGDSRRYLFSSPSGRLHRAEGSGRTFARKSASPTVAFTKKTKIILKDQGTPRYAMSLTPPVTKKSAHAISLHHTDRRY